MPIDTTPRGEESEGANFAYLLWGEGAMTCCEVCLSVLDPELKD